MEALAVSTVSIAIGELGDKTQILALVLSARLRKPLPIILGIFSATLLNHLLACLVGQWAGSLIGTQTLRWILGISFLAVGLWALVPEKMQPSTSARDNYGVFTVTAIAFFLAEMGDKTQIVALALAAKYHALASVVAGTTLGMMIVNVPTVLFAERATSWVPVSVVRIVAAAVYAFLGVVTLLGYSGIGP